MRCQETQTITCKACDITITTTFRRDVVVAVTIDGTNNRARQRGRESGA
jgi:hypothetical protein